MTKTFDCVEMKRLAQERIFAETQGLTRDEELEYFHRLAAEVRAELRQLRNKGLRSCEGGATVCK